MKTTKDALVTLGLLERGAFAHHLSKELSRSLQELKELAQVTKKAKGTLTIKINLDVEENSVEIRADVETKLPKLPRSKSIMFVMNDGALSESHPDQLNMMDRIAEVKKDDTAENKAA